MGPSGSGKTSLGVRLSKLKNTISIDTDNIDDKNSLKLLNKYDIDTNKGYNKFIKEVALLNKKNLHNILDKYKDKNIIFVGFRFNGLEEILNISDKKYSIKIDSDTLFRQYNLRTLNYIYENNDKIKKLLTNKNYSLTKIFFILLHKYKIRNGFRCKDEYNINDEIKFNKTLDIKNGYKIMSNNDIYKDILNSL
jgi:adenylate kinase family enzyme